MAAPRGYHLYYIILRQNLTPRAKWRDDVLQAHLEWAKRSAECGDLIFSGPAADKSMGIYLLRASTEAGAREIAERDPVISNGYCSYQLHDWDIQRGENLLETAT